MPEQLDEVPLENVLRSIQQCLAVAMGSSTDANVHTTQEHGGGLRTHRCFEEFSICFLSPYSGATNWKQRVSLQNKFGQTMAHMAVVLGYLRLLGSLVEWGIDLNLTDLKGSAALHYAFLCNELACAVFLIRSGADELALDELGRSPWDLNPSLVDEITSRLRGVRKVDGSFSVSCRPAEEEWETEPPGDAAVLKAKCVLVKEWLQRTEEEQSTTNAINSECIPVHFPCKPFDCHSPWAPPSRLLPYSC